MGTDGLATRGRPFQLFASLFRTIDMQFTLETTPWTAAAANWLIVAAPSRSNLAARSAALDKALGGQLSRLRQAGDLTGKSGETTRVARCAGIMAERLLLVGLGKWDKYDVATLQRTLATAARQISGKAVEHVAVAIAAGDSPELSLPQQVRIAATAMEVSRASSEGVVAGRGCRRSRRRWWPRRAPPSRFQGVAPRSLRPPPLIGRVAGLGGALPEVVEW